MRKVLFTLSILLLAIFIVGCNSANNEENNTTGNNDKGNNNDGNSENTEGSGDLKVTDDPLELTVHVHYADRVIFDDDWEVFKEAADLTNISLKGTASKTATDSEEVFNLMIGGNDIPDIVHGHKDKFNKYGPEGAFLPLEDLIEEHAPNLQKFLDENEDVRKNSISSDGHMYSVPYVPDGEAAKGWFIRQDWLDKLELDTPETVDDLYEVLKAFKEEDPNDTGSDDVVPYFARAVSGLEDLLLLWGAHVEEYLDGDEIKFGPIEPEYETAVDNMAKWYSEGLIDQEIFTRGQDAVNELIGGNKGGVTHDWFGSTASANDAYADDIEGLSFLPFAPPANVNGDVIEETSRPTVHPHGWGISFSNENIEETMKYLDFWYTEEGRRLANYGVEGETYTMEDGEPVFTDEVLNSENVPNHLIKYGAQVEIGFHQDFAYEEQWMNPIAKDGALDYIENDYFMEVIPELSYTTEEQKRLNKIEVEIQTYIDESFQKWILGSSDVKDDYANFKERLQGLGVDELLEIKNDAYQRYLDQ